MPIILIVDDSELDRKIAGKCVEALGAEATYAIHGRDALDKIAESAPDAVLTDLKMPEMDGLELVQAIRHNYPRIPVVLMTAYGNEDTAVNALRAGAASYVPKKNLKSDLTSAMRIVLDAAEGERDRSTVQQLFKLSVSQFIVGYEPSGPRALTNHLQEDMARLGFCDESDMIRIGTALTEAITNAVDHGNLELDSKLRERDDDSYRTLGLQRLTESPFRERRVYVSAELTNDRVAFTIRDEGKGFDPEKLPDPTDPANLTKPSGRGIMLIQTFMDEVRFNESGNEITMIKWRPTEEDDDDDDFYADD